MKSYLTTIETHKQLIHSVGMTKLRHDVKLTMAISIHLWFKGFMSTNAYRVLQLVKNYRIHIIVDGIFILVIWQIFG